MKHPTAVLIFIVLLVNSCASIQFDRQYKVNKGEEFVINLKTNPSTGYTWMIDEGLSDSLITLQGEDYIQAENKTGKPRLGVGGIKKWHFKAAKEGRTLLKFIYKRPGTEETSEIKHFRILVK